MDPLATRELGRTGVRVTQLGLGGAPIGRWPCGCRDDARDGSPGWTEAPLFDTALVRARAVRLHMGAGLRDLPRDQFVLSSSGRWLKRGRPATFDIAVGRREPVRDRVRLHLRRDHAPTSRASNTGVRRTTSR
jgi:D-threo-aldose 1-dehydrogenase